MPKLPKLTRSILGPPIRHGGPLTTGGPGLDDEYYIQPTVWPLPSSQWVQLDQDELSLRNIGSFGASLRVYRRLPLPVPPPFTDSDESHYVPPYSISIGSTLRIIPRAAPPLPVVFSDNDESNYVPPPTGGFGLDDDSWNNPGTTALPSSRWVQSDPDEIIRINIGSFGASLRIYLRPPLPIQPVFSDNDESNYVPLSTGFGLDEDYQSASLLLKQIQNLQPLSFDSDDISVGGFRLDEEYWQFPGFQPILLNQQPFTDTDELFFFVAPFGLDEDPWLWSLWRPQFIPPLPYPPATDQDGREGVPQPAPVDDDVWHGRRRPEGKRKAWPLPPPAFPLEKEEPPEILALKGENELTPEWLKTIVKKPLTPGRGLEYLPPLPVEIVPPKVFTIVKKTKVIPGISTEMLNAMQRNQEEEEAIISLLMRDEL